MLHICACRRMCVTEWSNRDTKRLSDAVRHPLLGGKAPRSNLGHLCLSWLWCLCICLCAPPMSNVCSLSNWDHPKGDSETVSAPKNTNQDLRQMQSGETTWARPYANKAAFLSSTTDGDSRTIHKCNSVFSLSSNSFNMCLLLVRKLNISCVYSYSMMKLNYCNKHT